MIEQSIILHKNIYILFINNTIYESKTKITIAEIPTIYKRSHLTGS